MISRSPAAHAAVWTDQADYSPGSVVTISGDNSDGAGYQAGEAVDVAVNGPGSITKACSATADGSGAWSCQFTLGSGSESVGSYAYTATGESSGYTQSGTFTDSACPAGNSVGNGNQPVDPYVAASFTTSGSTATYAIKTPGESPSGGVPGLIEYCVYTSPLPASEQALYDSWSAGTEANKGMFDFARSGGDGDNLPFDGSATTVGSATWSGSVPAADSQTIVLHINDPAVCTKLYGVSTATCFVLPATNQDLRVTKTATPSYTRTYTWTIGKSVDHARIVSSDGSATFTYTVEVSHDAGTDGSWQVAGKITVTNPNSADFSGVNVTDAIDNGGSCTVDNGTDATIPAGQSVDFRYTCTFASASSSTSGTNTATAAWDASLYNTPDASASGSASYDFSGVKPAIVDGTVSVTDTLGGKLGTASFTDTNPVTFQYPYTFTGDPAGTCTKHDNTATFTASDTQTTGSASQDVKVCVGADLAVSKTANPSFTRSYAWGIAKSVDASQRRIAAGQPATFNYTVSVTHDAGTDSAWQVAGTVTVTNPNDWEAVTADVADAVDNGGVCTVDNGTGVSIPAGGSADLAYTCTYSAAPTSASGTNTATATWDAGTYGTPDGSADGTADFAFTKPTTIVDGSVTVTDSLGGTLGTVAYTDPSPKDFSYPYTFSSDPGGTCTEHDNTATFTTDTTGTTGSASDAVSVCVGADLTVAKTATPTVTRTYKWTITKSASPAILDPGGTASYSVTATQTGISDSDWLVSGTITVSNPNDWEPVTLAGLADAISNGGSCSVTGWDGDAVIVPANGSVHLDYTCTYSAEPSSPDGINTATANWDQSAFYTPDASASGTAPADFGNPVVTATVNKTITVTDSQAGTLGTVTGTDGTPWASGTFTYTKKFSPPASGCTTVNNTATITETGQTASASVRDCNSGALTMGFWQNKNGQSIITGGHSTGVVCDSGTWLRQYKPFGDLSATATCAQVATYVTGIIKTANASGAAMNAMLKAQMLATALDVYFSDPALGGSKIGTPAPVGGLTIDLTRVCTMVDGSGGTATCSGSYENVSSAFGGAASLTVSQMLSYAAGQSTTGGTSWYGQNKGTQGLAKDAFDAINNQAATGP